VLTVSVDVNGEGRPEYSVSRLGTPVILPSRLGFLLTDAPKLERNFAIAEGPPQRRQRWEQPWGERRFVRDRHNELRVRLTEKARPGAASTSSSASSTTASASATNSQPRSAR
jgi:alpha-glucosidase